MVAKKNKSNLTFSFSDKPIIKNGYVMALLVFLGLVIAFNVADNYSRNTGNEVTGLAFADSMGKITSLLTELTKFIFDDLLEGTVLGSFILYTDGIMRVLVFIVIFTILALFRLPKSINAIIALVVAVFIPQGVIASIFGQNALFGGGLGLVIWSAAIYLPLFGLFKWLKHTRNKLASFLLAFLFLGWLSVISYVEGEVTIIAFRDLWDVLVGFGNIACMFGFIWGVWKGFTAGGKKSPLLDYKNMDDFIKGGGIKGDWERTKGHFTGLLGKTEAEKRAEEQKRARLMMSATEKALSERRAAIIKYYDTNIAASYRRGDIPAAKKLEKEKMAELTKIGAWAATKKATAVKKSKSKKP